MNWTAFRALPLSHQCAVETLLNSGDRTVERLNALCQHFEAAYGMTDPQANAVLRERAAIAAGLRA